MSFPCRYLSFFIGALLHVGGFSQCGVTINTFPYQEDFEASAAWTSGGVGDDWAWGTPAHAVINSAGGGLRSWNVGGLTGAFYNLSEQSWLEGPCFDFTAVQFPMVSFKIFWECERTYDGAGFQYSLDQGNSWNNVGSYNDPPECVNANWFNAFDILNLNLAQPREGWSGRIGPTSGSCAGGAGSAGWVTASHCLVDLAGEPSVKFRFIFGAGSTCNNYDGVAIDDVFIGEAPPESASFSYECFGDEVSVHDIVSCATSWSWNFDDPASGSANTSTLPTVDHVFSAPGTYDITLSLTYSCRPPQEVVSTVNILDLQMASTDPTCAGNDGSASVFVSGASGPLTYAWSPGGGSTGAITGLGAGTYTVTISDGGNCPADGSVTLASPPNAPTVSVAAANATCNGSSDGTATVSVNGGTPAYGYAWSPQGGTGPTAAGLPAGNYTCTVTDASNCIASAQVTITEPDALVITAQPDTAICLGESVTLTATASGGTAPYDFTWSPEGPAVTPLAATAYTVNATDANGCTAIAQSISVEVGSVAPPQFVRDDSLGCSPHCVLFTTADAGNGSYAWDFGDGTIGSVGPEITHCYVQAGVYDVVLTITGNGGCSGSWTMPQAVEVLPTPNAGFTAYPAVATIEDANIQFVDASSGAETWSWSFGDPLDSTSTERSPVFTYEEVGCYEVQLVVSNTLTCSDSTSYVVCIEDEFAAYVPNAFTPNDDGFNDVWGVVITVGSPREFELDVFDRWGGIVFHSEDKGQFWDGTAQGGEQPIGVYQWRLRLRDSTGRIQERKGHLTLVR